MKIAFISCVKSKRQGSWMAKDLYISDLFKKSYAFCKQNYDQVYILSAYYGLLEPMTYIECYDRSVNKMTILQRNKWYDDVAGEIRSIINLDDQLYFYCGANYRSGLIERLKNTCYEPLKGLSFGNQLKFYKQNLNNTLW